MARNQLILFTCEGNRHRSPTAQRLYANTPGLITRSAGLSDQARVQVEEELLRWADRIFVMEARLQRLLLRRFLDELQGKMVICLDIPDDYQADQPELLAILTERLRPHLGEPVPAAS